MCTTAITNAGVTRRFRVAPRAWLSVIEHHFRRYFGEWDSQQGAQSPMDVHLRNVARFPGRWGRTKSSRCCLLCFSRPPETPAPGCGHRICYTCLQDVSVGRTTPVTPGTFILETCPLCNGDAGRLSIAVPRPTAAPRVLVFDGGGNRVIIGLEVLRLLAQEVPVPGFVHRMFDIVTGTSSGKSTWWNRRRPPLSYLVPQVGWRP